MKDDDDANDVSEMRKKVKSGTQKPNVPYDPNRKRLISPDPSSRLFKLNFAGSSNFDGFQFQPLFQQT